VPLSDSIVLADSGRWSILTTGGRRGSQLEKIARDVVLKASVPALKDAPFGKFGDQGTYDRTEIEGFRAIRNLINEFLKQPVPKRPLCLAVFGPPGSGKSFGVEEVAKSVSGGDVKVVRLEFNVSQFRDSDELAASLQLVRDRVLSGEVPLVFFDEFDAKLEELDNGWLKYFLAPMQDGKFLDRGMLHPIGKAIFVFAGGTRDTFQEFCPRQPTAHEVDTDVGEVSVVKKYRKFRDAKGPDFVSRLRGYINISGPNPRDDSDQAYVIRRAVMLRSILKRKAGHLFDSSEQAQIDDGVLRAMLKVSRFQHGTRSMEAILDMSMLANAKRFEAATLPSADQLELHVPAEEFFQLINADRPFGAARELIARAIHEKYRAEQAGNKTPDHPSMQPWETLRGDLLASNLAQAEDIPNKLSFLGLAFESVATPHYKLAKDNRIVFDDAIKVAGEIMSKEIIIYKNLEILAEMEHERWVSEKLQSGWRYAQSRDDSKKLHTDLVPWVNLPDPTKAYDRNTIKAIPDVLANAGYRLFRANGN
ncbi:MAG: RyR domain-containing protein, partial [Pirellulaceae bacterium]